MRKKLGILLMLLGIGLVMGAGFLLLHNRQKAQIAGEYSQAVLPELQQQIQKARTEQPEIQQTQHVPRDDPQPEDYTMTEKTVNGYAYIGCLVIPELGLELPVMSGWDSQRLQMAPCRYAGSLRGGDMVIMAHNYDSHFGRLSRLSVGAQVQFADMDGQVWNYQVAAMDVLAGDAVEEMTDGTYDLTLFTCAANRTHRVTIRCNRI